MNTGNTKNTGGSTGKRVNHVPWNCRSTWLTVCHRRSIVFPVFIVFIVGFAHTMRSAQCALPANRPPNHALLNLQGTWHSLHHVPVRQVRQVRPPRSHHALCAMRSASHTPTRPCATKIQKHMALSMPCAPLSILSILSIMSIFIAHSIGSAQSAPPTNKKRTCAMHKSCEPGGSRARQGDSRPHAGGCYPLRGAESPSERGKRRFHRRRFPNP